VYSASKFAVRALTEALDVEFRDRRVRIADIMPSYVDTPMVRSQTHRPKSLDRLGIKLSPEAIAETVWEAAHGTDLHYIPQLNFRVFSRVGGALPRAARRVVRALLG
jgi:short-subunit dehydrogenase